MGFDYDVAIIGTGTSAYTAAYACRRAGKRVAITDRLPYGGTCALRGCQPKKYLIAAADAISRASRMQGIGVKGIPEIDWPALIRSKTAFTENVPDDTENSFLEEGIDTFYSSARFKGPNTLLVGDREISAENIIIATGAKPRALNIPGEEHVITSDVFMDLASLPSEILFAGGGYVSFEFAYVARMAGAKVTILQRGGQVLKRFDKDLVQKLVETSKEAGIDIMTNVCVGKIEKQGDRYLTHCLDDPDQVFEADMVVHGAGRVPATHDLDLDVAEVDYSPNGVTVNEYMQSTSNSSVYAIGDVSATPFRLATTADMEGEIAAQNIIHGNTMKADYTVVPSVVFTYPPMATVGLGETESKEKGKSIKVNFGNMSAWNSSKRIGQKHAAYKVLIDEETDLILGAHLLGHNSEETINVFAMAMRCGISTTALKKNLWAYPTSISDIKYMI